MANLISFQNDYAEGAHPAILEALTRDPSVQEPGYGMDAYSERAAARIRDVCAVPNADVHFLMGGTQTNLVACAAFLKPYESIVAAESGHICVHETGAIEATGHKIHSLPHADGKLTPDRIRDVVRAHSSEHMVHPRMVFISQSTEVGTIYTRRELESISEVCRELDLILYLDGARLGAALACRSGDLTLSEIAGLVDAFYIGGTKNGALFGEALVITNAELRPGVRYHLKQRGALLAKGRALGAQFEALFTDNLFHTLAVHADHMALLLAEGFSRAGFEFAYPPTTNQIFPILPNGVIRSLQERFAFYVWNEIDSVSSVARFVTSWATNEASVRELIQRL